LTDEELIEKMAVLWIENGGDEDGIHFCYGRIANKVRELTELDEDYD
jgi:hypothetical protein